jgi:acetolactate decarboxylase
MQKRLLVAVCAFWWIYAVAGCATPRPDTVTQVSTIDALLAGGYDGQVRCSALREYGDFGIGTFHALDGEMVLFDGTVYQVRSDGDVTTPPGRTTTPFAAVCCFDADSVLTLTKPMDRAALEKHLDRSFPDRNAIYAVCVQGTFRQMKTRSVPAQKKPYPPLAEVTRHQPVFTMEEASGVLVGFRLPPFAKGINVPGYHLHFLSDDRSQGGHVLDFTLEKGTVEMDRCHRFTMILPEKEGDFSRLDLSRDRAKELESVER